MANERVSQLLEIYAGDLALNDLFLVTDMSQHESKKLELTQLMAYIEASGSFTAVTAVTALTAAFVLGSNVSGPVTSASYADYALIADSSSYALSAKSASRAVTTWYAETASYFLGGVVSTTSASHADRADWADNTGNASFLYYSGTPNGTSSWAMSGSATRYANSSSYAQSASVSISSSRATTASFSEQAGSSSYTEQAGSASYVTTNASPVKAWACVTWSVADAAQPVIYQSHNIANITWWKTIDLGAPPGSAGYWDLYYVDFVTPLPHINYTCHGMMVGTLGYYGIGVGVSPVMAMPYESRSINGFTMSINTGTGINRTIAFGGFTTANFQILG